MKSNEFQSFTKLGANSSRIAKDLLKLIPDSDRRALSLPNELLTFSDRGTMVAIRVTADNVGHVTPLLKELGFEVLGSAPEHHFIEGWMPIDSLLTLESLSIEGLLGATPIYQPRTSVGSVTSQADRVHQADLVREELGIDGTGITIGVMSDSYNNLGDATTDINTGDLPSGGRINVLQDLDGGGSDEGRAMMQLIHDLAPGSNLAFSSVFFGELDFAQQIRNLADPELGNADVLVDDIVYFAEPFFQDGAIAQAVDEVVTTRDVTYFAAAANSSDGAYESTNFAAAADSEGFFTDAFHDFDPTAGVDTRQNITIPASSTVIFSFQWDDPFYTADGVDTDLGIFLLEAGTNNVVAGADENNILNQQPVEILNFTNDSSFSQDYDVVITLNEGPEPGRIKYVNFGREIVFNEFDTNSSTVSPHAAAINARAVSASPYFDPTIPESFTSVGPSTILFEPDGTRKATPEIRQTPDLTAVDGTDTTFFGFDFDGNGFPNFFGTSAAAPHAAAIAALVRQANPNLTPQEVYDILAETAIDIGAPGVDNVTGAGLINAFDAVSSALPNVAPTIDRSSIDVNLIVIDDDDGDDNEGLLITIEGTFTDPNFLDLHTGTAQWSDGVSVDFDDIGLGDRTFTTSRFLSEEELEDNFPEIDNDDNNFPGLDDDDIFQVGVNLTVKDDDMGMDTVSFEFFVGEEGGIFVPEIV